MFMFYGCTPGGLPKRLGRFFTYSFLVGNKRRTYPKGIIFPQSLQITSKFRVSVLGFRIGAWEVYTLFSDDGLRRVQVYSVDPDSRHSKPLSLKSIPLQ